MDRRSLPRSDYELDARLLSAQARLLDPHAVVAGLSLSSFELRAHGKLEKNAFHGVILELPNRGTIRCDVELVWVDQARGRWIAGARIVKISRMNARRLRLFLDPRAFDYARGLGQAFIGFLCGLAIAAGVDIIRHRPELLRVMAGLIPESLVLSLMGLAVILAFRMRK